MGGFGVRSALSFLLILTCFDLGRPASLGDELERLLSYPKDELERLADTKREEEVVNLLSQLADQLKSDDAKEDTKREDATLIKENEEVKRIEADLFEANDDTKREDATLIGEKDETIHVEADPFEANDETKRAEATLIGDEDETKRVEAFLNEANDETKRVEATLIGEEDETKRINADLFEANYDSKREVALLDEARDEHDDDVEKLLKNELKEGADERKKYGSILIEHGKEIKPKIPEDVELVQTAGVGGDMFGTDVVLSHQQKVALGLESETPDEVFNIRKEEDDDWSSKTKRKYIAAVGGKQLWDRGIIPWDFSATRNFTDPKSHAKIIAALRYLEDNSCLRFARRGSALAKLVTHKNSMEFGTGSGCWAYVGMTGSGKQIVNLQENACLRLGVILHEVGHSLGMYHEQIRSDRDQYVTVDFDNIGNRARSNFELKPRSHNYAPYDLESDLQYGKFYFSKNDKPTIMTKDPDLQFLINPPNRAGLSFYDLMALNHAYSCTARCRKPLRRCDNHGFVGHRCTCVCPSGLTGSDCSRIDRRMSPSCGGIITLRGHGDSNTFTTPNYPGTTDKTTCVWVIKATPDHFVNLEFRDFDLAKTMKPNNEFKCENSVQIRYNLVGQTGPRFCGSDMGQKTFTTMTKVKGRERDMWIMMVILESGGKNIPQRGFSAKVIAHDIPGCMRRTCYNQGTCEDGGTKTAICRCGRGIIGENCELVGGAVSRSNFDNKDNHDGFDAFTNVDSDHGTWIRAKGRTPSDATGPNGDVKGQGYFLYIEGSSPQKPGDKLRLETVSSFQDRERCLEFAYSMYGSCLGSLRVFQSARGTERKLWEKTGNQGQRWGVAKVNIPRMGANYKLIIEGEVGSCFLSDMAIDEVYIYPSRCGGSRREMTDEPIEKPNTPAIKLHVTPQVITTTKKGPRPVAAVTGAGIADYKTTCDFEKGFCDFTQVSNDNFDWSITDGPTKTPYTGPKGDHTTGSGKYVYIDSAYKNKGDQATLELPVAYYTSGEACLEFWYNNYGYSPSSIRVRTNDQGAPDTIFFSNSAPWKQDESSWHWVQVQIQKTGKFKVSFTGERGANVGGDLAIDDVSLRPGSCAKVNEPIKCDFEKHSSNVEQAPDDDFDWTKQSGTTPSSSTGPSSDHTTGQGHYMFIEASSPAVTNWRSTLLLPYTQFAGPSCLYFWYNNNSPQPSKLYVETRKDDGSRKTIFTLNENTGDVWKMAGVQLTTRERFRVAFMGVRGSGHLGDLAIDDISLAAGTCTKVDFTMTCDFEKSIEACGLEQIMNDDYDWELNSGPTTTEGTGPTGDHTSGKGQYAYIEASGKMPNFNAGLATPSVIYPLNTSCIGLWYHSKGSNPSKLQVFTLHPDGTNKKIWASDGTTSDEWRYVAIPVTRTGLFRVALIGTRGKSSHGDLAIDDLEIKPGRCGPERVFSCGFNANTCNVRFTSDANVDWMMARRAYSAAYGPEGGDRTSTGRYVIMVEQVKGTDGTANMMTPFLDLKDDFCVSFFTQIYDGREATMKVSARKRDGSERGEEYSLGLGSIIKWKGWLQAQLPFPASRMGEFRIEFHLSKTAKLSQGFAFDDLAITSGKCK